MGALVFRFFARGPISLKLSSLRIEGLKILFIHLESQKILFIGQSISPVTDT
jgi:hypothetical protein